MADFFCGWRSALFWENMIFPYEEGGVAIHLMSDVCQTFQYKQWWLFRSKQILWGDFLRAKYSQRSNPGCKNGIQGNLKLEDT